MGTTTYIFNIIVPDPADGPDASVVPVPFGSGPLTADQRRALFAGCRNVFGDILNQDRYALTRAVLDLPADAPVSWSSVDDHAITYKQASHLLNVLSVMESII